MESTEKCEAVISHFNGKFLKTPAGVMGKCVPLTVMELFTKNENTIIVCSLFLPQKISKEDPCLFFPHIIRVNNDRLSFLGELLL